MHTKFHIKHFRFYLWVGLAYLLFWLIIDLSGHPDAIFARVVNNAWLAAFIIVVNFISFEYALPFIRRKKETILPNIAFAILTLIALLLIYSFGLYGWRYIGIRLHLYTPLKTFASIPEGVLYVFPHGLISVFFFGLIKHLYDHVKLKQSAQQLRIEKQEAELSYLRSQTNPHFLFNTLNNIYSLARDKSDLAPESILRLSKMLRFMLYETGGEYIALEQELKIISDYVSLEKLRYDESLKVRFDYDIEDMKQGLPPLLLMPLVENAFKHGASETREDPFVDIRLSVHKQELEFSVKNSTEAFPKEAVWKENIGLSNLRRQLELLYKDYDLSIRQEELAFTATLKINLASHV